MSVRARLIAALEDRAASKRKLFYAVAAGVEGHTLDAMRAGIHILSMRIDVMSATFAAEIKKAA